MSLPAPGIVVDRAEMVAKETTEFVGNPGMINVLPAWLHAVSPPGPTTREEDAFVGPTAGDLGRLHAATSAVSEAGHACLHFPDPDHTASGPWLVVEPLAGRLSTVHRGAGIAKVMGEPVGDGVDGALRELSDRLQSILEAARPRHRLYPVDRDAQGVFTTGLTTFGLKEVSMHDGAPHVTFDVATTPATQAAAVEDRFAGVEGVKRVNFEAEVPVAHAHPDPTLLDAAEAVAEQVFGDWEYEWGPAPTEFSRIPSPDKLALGTGMPEAERCETETIQRCQRLLEGVLAQPEGTE